MYWYRLTLFLSTPSMLNQTWVWDRIWLTMCTLNHQCDVLINIPQQIRQFNWYLTCMHCCPVFVLKKKQFTFTAFAVFFNKTYLVSPHWIASFNPTITVLVAIFSLMHSSLINYFDCKLIQSYSNYLNHPCLIKYHLDLPDHYMW